MRKFYESDRNKEAGFLMILPIVLFCLFLPTQSISQSIVIDPPVLHFDAHGGQGFFQILFEDEPFSWELQTDYDWLDFELMAGEGNAEIIFFCHPNLGMPGRVAKISLVAEGAENSPVDIYVRQFHDLPPGMFEFDFEQLEFEAEEGEVFLSNIGRMNVTYPPFEQGMFLNVMARSEFNPEPAWIIRNLYLPDASWIANPQTLSVRFPMSLLGLEEGIPLNQLEYTYNVSPVLDTTIPWFPPSFWFPDEVILKALRAFGRFLDGEAVDIDTLLSYPIFKLPFEITDLYYIGCYMENGDLDDATRPGELNGCGPAAAANSLKWLEKNHKEIKNLPEWRKAFNQLSTLMARKPSHGVQDGDFIRAKLDFIEAHNLPIKVKYQDDGIQGDVKSSSGQSKAECKDAKSTDYPKKSWLVSEVKDDEDVEMGVTYPSAIGGGHWVAISGTVTINGETYVYYKHDTDQKVKDSTKQEVSRIVEKDGKMIIPELSNATCDIVVSESFDDKHKPLPTEFEFEKYCQSAKKTIPPGKTITVSYPDSPKRCFNTTVRVLDRSVSGSFKKVAQWNYNRGKTRKYTNKTGHPVTVEFHNDDYYNGGSFKSYTSYNISLLTEESEIDDVTDPDNERVYGGFSMGADDDSSDEFGLFYAVELYYVDSTGASLHDITQRLSYNGTIRQFINKQVDDWNTYWTDLDLIIGVSSVESPGYLRIVSDATGYQDSILIDAGGEYRIAIGGMENAGNFDLLLEAASNTDFWIDNIGIPTKVQMNPMIGLYEDELRVDDIAGEICFILFNDGEGALSWTLEKDESSDWLSIDKTSGIGEDIITVNYEANPGAERRGEIVITAEECDNSPQSLAIIQEAFGSSVAKTTLSDAVKVYPNPGNGLLQIEINTLEAGSIIFELYDMSGKTLKKSNFMKPEGRYRSSLNFTEVPKGLYYLMIQADKEKCIQKIFIQ